MLNTKNIKTIDKSGMYDVLKNFHNQVKGALLIAEKADVSKFRRYDFSNVIISGLGGSAIGGDLLRSYTYYESRIPVSVNRNYTLPAFADENTLVILSSYSGNTEETVSAYTQAIEKKCKIICVTSGGVVEKMAQKNKHFYVKIPGGLQPRCALGYSFFTLLILFSKLGFIEDKTKEIKSTVKTIEDGSQNYSLLEVEKNPAFKIASALFGKLPVIYSSTDVLDVVNLRWRGQISENAKILVYGNVYPEMNHNELVGWTLNEDILKKIVVIFLKDVNDNERIKARMNITSEIYKKFANNIIHLESDGKTGLDRIFDLIYLGDWVSYYLAILNNVDPTPVDSINYLKKQLEKI